MNEEYCPACSADVVLTINGLCPECQKDFEDGAIGYCEQHEDYFRHACLWCRFEGKQES